MNVVRWLLVANAAVCSFLVYFLAVESSFNQGFSDWLKWQNLQPVLDGAFAAIGGLIVCNAFFFLRGLDRRVGSAALAAASRPMAISTVRETPAPPVEPSLPDAQTGDLTLNSENVNAWIDRKNSTYQLVERYPKPPEQVSQVSTNRNSKSGGQNTDDRRT